MYPLSLGSPPSVDLCIVPMLWFSLMVSICCKEASVMRGGDYTYFWMSFPWDFATLSFPISIAIAVQFLLLLNSYSIFASFFMLT